MPKAESNRGKILSLEPAERAYSGQASGNQGPPNLKLLGAEHAEAADGLHYGVTSNA